MTDSCAGEPCIPAVRRARAVAATAALSTVALGAAVLAGWAAHLEWLKRVLPAFAPMYPVTALSFILGGAALWWLRDERGAATPGGRRVLGQLAAAGVVLIAALTLAAGLFGWDLFLDSALFGEDLAAAQAPHPGRMSIPTAVSFALAGGALLLLDHETERWGGAAAWLALLAATGGGTVLFGYLFAVVRLPAPVSFTLMAAHTAAGAVVLAAGIIAARPRRGPLALFLARCTAGGMLRRLVPVAVAGPLVVGWLSLEVRRGGLVTPEAGILLFAAVVVLLLLAALHVTARQIQAADRERRRNEETLTDLEARYRLIAEATSDAIVVTERGVVKEVNQGLQRIFGYAPEEVLGRTPERLLDPAVREAVMARMADGDERVYEHVGLTRDGRRIDLEIVPRVLDRARGIRVTALRDVSQQRAAERRLRVKAAALNAAAVAVMITEHDGVIIWVNAAWETLTGFSSADAIGRKPNMLKSGVQDQAYYRDLWSAILAGKVVRTNHVNKRKDGSLQRVEATITPVVDGAGQVTHFIAITQDVTELVQLHEQLLHAQRIDSIGRLAGGIAHDFNNLITVILGAADLAQSGIDDPESARRDIEEVRRTAQRAAALTRQLLAFSRKQVMRLEVVSVNEAIGGMQEMLQRLIGEAILLGFSPGGSGQVRVDRGQLEQVIMNLAVNARDAMPQGGALTFATGDVELDEAFARRHPSVVPGPFVRITARDTGVGMDEDTRAKVFEPFFTTKGLGHGTGLGLSTVYGIVKQSGGSIWVTSSPGAGSTFDIYLPRVEGVATAPAPAPAPGAGARHETILIAEDEPALRDVAARALRRAGYSVLTAANGADALSLLEDRGGTVDLLLTDVVMPGMSGRELALQVGARYPRVRVVYTSGYTADAITRAGALEPGIEFLAKPYTIDELARKVREVLDA